MSLRWYSLESTWSHRPTFGCDCSQGKELVLLWPTTVVFTDYQMLCVSPTSGEMEEGITERKEESQTKIALKPYLYGSEWSQFFGALSCAVVSVPNASLNLPRCHWTKMAGQRWVAVPGPLSKMTAQSWDSALPALFSSSANKNVCTWTPYDSSVQCLV